MDDKTLAATRNYLANGADACPHCYSKNIDSTEHEFRRSSPSKVALDMACDDCGATWTEVYSVTEVANFQPPVKKPSAPMDDMLRLLMPGLP